MFNALNFPIKLSLYIGIPSLAVFIYFFNKSNKTEEEETSYDEAIRSRSSVVEVKVPADCVRPIIGTQGCVIKEIQRKTNTRINFKDKNREGLKDDCDQILVIRGSNINIQQAELEIKRFILDMPVVLTEEYYVPEYCCGRIIGRGGANIKEMSLISNCKIKLTDRRPSKNASVANDLLNAAIELNASQRKIITLSGSVEQIASAKNLILSKIKEEEAIRERRANNNNKFKQPNYNNYSNNNISNVLNNNNNKQETNISTSTSLSSESIAPKQLPLPPPIDIQSVLDENKSMNVYISAVAHPYAFWIQVVNEEATLLDKQIDKLNEYYAKNINCSFQSIDEIKIGSLVGGVFNRSWYRVEVKGFHTEADSTEKMADVFYVDFGDSAYLKLDELRRLPEEFYTLPQQAIECSLEGIELNENENKWSEEAVTCFEDITYSCKWKLINLEFVQMKTDFFNRKRQKPSVRLYDKAKNLVIAEVLAESGHGKVIQPMTAEIKEEKIDDESKSVS